jgi:hypothetical protein
MKIISAFSLYGLVLLFSVAAISQDKHPDVEFKKLINTTFNDENNIPALTGYQLQESTLLNSIDDPERLFLNVYSKGFARAVLFTALTDTVAFTFRILDVLHLKSVREELEFKSVTCRRDKIENSQILALVKPAGKSYFTDIKKAWICDREKGRLRAISVKGIDCLNEGYEQF